MGRSRKRYTDEEDAFIRRWYKVKPTEEISQKLGRTCKSIYMRALILGVTTPLEDTEVVTDFVKRWHAKGYSNARIIAQGKAEGLTFSKARVANILLRLGLSSNQYSEFQRSVKREGVKRQLSAAGVDSLAEVKNVAVRKFATENGWPPELNPSEVLVMEALWRYGPMTRREIAQAIGVRSTGHSRTLMRTRKNDSATSYLIRLGLVVVLRKHRKGVGRGGSVDVYAIRAGVVKHGDESNGREQCHGAIGVG